MPGTSRFLSHYRFIFIVATTFLVVSSGSAPDQKLARSLTLAKAVALRDIPRAIALCEREELVYDPELDPPLIKSLRELLEDAPEAVNLLACCIQKGVAKAPPNSPVLMASPKPAGLKAPPHHPALQHPTKHR